MPDHVRRGNATKSKFRARVEHVFAQQKVTMGQFIRTHPLRAALSVGCRTGLKFALICELRSGCCGPDHGFRRT